MRRSIGRFGLALAAVVAGALTACEPPPPPPAPDGRDLGITVNSQPPAHLVPGQVATVQVEVRNHGSVPADGVRFGLLSTGNLEVVDVDVESLGQCTTAGQLFDCRKHQPLLPDFEWTITAHVRATAMGPVSMMVAASSAGTEPAVDPHPNSQLLSTSVDTNGTVDLQAIGWSWAGSAPVPTLGVPMYSYTTVTNNLGHAFGVTVTQELPAGFVIHDATFGHSDPDGDEEGSCSVAGQTVTCTTGDTPGHWISNSDDTDQWLMQVRATPTVAGTFSIGHEAQSGHPEPAPDPHANTATHLVTVAPA